MSDIYLSITETPTVVTLTNPLISSNVAQSVTVTNVVTVSVVTMPAITVQAAAPAVTTVAGTVSISNFPSTQTIAGTVTANGGDFTVSPFGQQPPSKLVVVGGYDAANDEIRLMPLSEGADRVCVEALIVNGQNGAPVTAGNPFQISGTVTVGNSVTIGSLPAISGTVTANVNFSADLDGVNVPRPSQGIALGYLGDSQTFFYPVHEDQGLPVRIQGQSATQPISGTVTVGNSVTIGSIPAISGTVTANLSKLVSHASTITKSDNQVQIIGGYSGGSPTNATAYPIGVDSVGNISSNLYWSGIGLQPTAVATASPLPVQVVSQGSVTIGSVPNGSLTTRFGTPTTANVSFATSAVTNANRKYLLIQNVTTGSNVITVGIGFTPTTTQGIQLTAGAGITFESSYIPTGAVYVLSSVTASNFTILEA